MDFYYENVIFQGIFRDNSKFPDIYYKIITVCKKRSGCRGRSSLTQRFATKFARALVCHLKRERENGLVLV